MEHKRHVSTACWTMLSLQWMHWKMTKNKTLPLKILLGNTLQAPSLKCSSSCHTAPDGYTTPVFNLSHRLRACHMCFLWALCSLRALCPQWDLRQEMCNMLRSAKDQKPPLVFCFLCIHSHWRNNVHLTCSYVYAFGRHFYLKQLMSQVGRQCKGVPYWR